MALMRRTRTEPDWPAWPERFAGFRGLDWPTSFRDLMSESAIKVEEFQEDDHLVVRAEMPGIDPEKDVEITVADHMLHLRAERHQEERTEDKTGFHSEFRYGSFSRSVPLPVGTTEDDVTASYTDGILEVRFPVEAGGGDTHKIPVTRG